MRKMFALMCIFALIATTMVANVTPNVIDTSPIEWVDNFTPTADVVMDVAPIAADEYVFSSIPIPLFDAAFVATALESPNIGYLLNSDTEINATTFALDVLPDVPINYNNVNVNTELNDETVLQISNRWLIYKQCSEVITS